MGPQWDRWGCCRRADPVPWFVFPLPQMPLPSCKRSRARNRAASSCKQVSSELEIPGRAARGSLECVCPPWRERRAWLCASQVCPGFAGTFLGQDLACVALTGLSVALVAGQCDFGANCRFSHMTEQDLEKLSAQVQGESWSQRLPTGL